MEQNSSYKSHKSHNSNHCAAWTGPGPATSAHRACSGSVQEDGKVHLVDHGHFLGH